MYKSMNQLAAFVGADCPTILLSSGYGQIDGIAVSSDLRRKTGLFGPAFGANASWRSEDGTSVSVLGAKQQIPTTVVRERLPLVDAHVLGSPPRGAPV